MSKVRLDNLSVPSSLRVFPTTSWATSDYFVPHELNHLRAEKCCPVCSGWQSIEELVVHKASGKSVKRVVSRCHGSRSRLVPKCPARVLGEYPLDNTQSA